MLFLVYKIHRTEYSKRISKAEQVLLVDIEMRHLFGVYAPTAEIALQLAKIQRPELGHNIAIGVSP